jgi:amino acid adenylation domain-containing protein/non-ribosomal peptide synthase protein (TIGR01720 family)
MSDFHKSVANLSPEQKRQLLAQLLQKKANQARRFPLSFAQKRLWFLDQLQPGLPTYNIPAALHLRGSLNIAALELSINQIMQRHEVLRSSFTVVQDEPYQQVYPHLTLQLPLIDLQALPAEKQQQEVQNKVREEAAQPFDLSCAPLFRAKLLKLNPGEYVLLFTMNHIISDYWSMRILIRELGTIYESLSKGETAHLPELPVQYGDYAVWQQQWLKGEQRSTQLAYWQQQLANHPSVLALPTDYTRPAVQTFRGARRSFSLSPDLSNALKSLSQSRGVTLFMTLLAAFKVLLYRYTGQDDILIGSTIANRNRSEITDLIGLFVNNLIFRTNLSGNPSFCTFLQQVREVTLSAYAHQDLPFEYLVEQLQPERNLSHNPLFQVMFILHNTPTQTLTLSGLSLNYLEPEHETARFDLSLDMYETTSGLRGIFEYNTDLFTTATIDRIILHLQTLLAGIVAHPEQRILQLPVLTSVEHQQFLEWNNTNRDYPNVCVHQLFEAQVERTPDAVAVVFETEQITYQELNQRANQLAHYLQTLGVQQETRVGICLERSIDMIVGLLGILKAGGTYIPIDPAYPQERRDFMLCDAQLSVLLKSEVEEWKSEVGTDNSQFSIPQCEFPILICLDTNWEANAYGTALPNVQHRCDNPTSQTTPENLAYIIYTSGSTGKPKGVQILHKALVNFLESMRQIPGVTSNDVLLSVTTLSFDIAALELYLPLIVGARLVIVSRDIISDGIQLAKRLATSQATVMQATPATWRLLLAAGWRGEKRLKILCGGEALDSSVALELLKCGKEVWNLYGPTETTIWSSVYRVEFGKNSEFGIRSSEFGKNSEFGIRSSEFGKNSEFGIENIPCPDALATELGNDITTELPTSDFRLPNSIPIGCPIANTQFYVLDDYLQQLPVGVPGQLYISGLSLARGYLNASELTADKFLPNPFVNSELGIRNSENDQSNQLCSSNSDFGTLYKTGDLVRYRPDGTLEYLSRIDDQVKLRGFRIELGEIEAALMQHPQVQQAVVILDKNQQDERLVAYVVPSSPVFHTELRRFLETKLPYYMLPSAYVMLDELPLTPNGKVDRKSLLALDQPQQQRTFVSPRTPIEEMLALIWAEILGVSQISIDDNFFTLGGHSLLATRAISQIRQVFAVDLPLRRLFEAPTIALLAQAIATTKSELPLSSIERVPRQGKLPISFAQQRQWFLSQLEPESPFYNIPAAVQISGALDISILQRSLNEIIRRHEVLRTTFQTIEGQPVAQVSSATELELPLCDLSTLSSSEQEIQVRQLAQQEARQPFFLDRSPLLRVKLLRLNAQTHVILVTMHHIAADGWSVGVLVREIALLYQAERQRHPRKQPDLPIQYADFAAWQRQWLEKEVLETQLNYWRKQLQGVPPLLELPTDRPRKAVQTNRGGSLTFELEQKLAQALKSLSHKSGCTLFMTLLAAFKTLLYRYSDSEDIIVGSPIANRNRAELEGMIGCFANTLVLRTDLSGNPSFLELLHRVKEMALGAYTHQDLPFEQLVEDLQLERSLSYTPLFQVMFLLQNAPIGTLEVEDLSWSPIISDSGTAKFDLTLAMSETANLLTGRFEYNQDLFDSSTVHRMVGHWQTLLEAIVANPNQRLSELPLLTPPERQQLLIEWNQTQIHYPETCIHQLFEAQVKQTPDAIVLIDGNQQLTYSVLNARANKLAHYLSKLGVKPETRVGICIERSTDMVIGLLGILKAGGAYVPLDPRLPQERLTFMLEDAQVTVLLTQAGRQEAEHSIQNDTISKTIYLDTDWKVNAKESTANPNVKVEPENLAYVIYTSGTQGKPKGVAIAHRSAVTLINWAGDVFTKEQLAGVLASTSICFDLSVFELFVPLCWGGKSIIAENALQLSELPAAEAVTLINTVPSAIAQLSGINAIPPSVHTVNLAGEALQQSLVEQLQHHSHIQQIFNLYGPSEDTTYSTYALINSRQKFGIRNSEFGTTPPIGRPIANTQTYILDRHLQPVPIGVRGELYIGGDGLARGYLNQPELTAEKFIPNPFGNSGLGIRNISYTDALATENNQITQLRSSNSQFRILYKTGDRVRYLPDGNIEYLGRLDNQVKIRGFRIELGEIETVINQHPEVTSAVAKVWDDQLGNKRLIAYVVVNSELGIWNSESQVLNSDFQTQLRHFLQDKLPDYMIPSIFVMLEAMPLTANGKIDRRALPTPDTTKSERNNTVVLPRSPQEKQLAEIWSQLLGIESVGIDDNFFELGGDSILAIQVIAKASKAGLHLTPKQVFQYQTIAQLAAVASTVSVKAEQGTVTGIVPLTPIQHWFFEQNFADFHHWNQSILLKLSPSIQPQWLEQIVQRLLEHHDALRLRFLSTVSGWQQINGSLDLETPFSYVDLSALAQKEQELAIAMAAPALQTSLNLSTTLVRVAFFDLGASQPSRLLFVIHHLAIDGVSWRILLADLQTAFGQLHANQLIQLPPKTTSFKQWAESLQTHANSQILAHTLEYWHAANQLSMVSLPVDYPGGNNTVADADTLSIFFSSEETQTLLQKVPAAYQTQINDVLLTALVQAFEPLTGEQGLLVELEGHGREDLFEMMDVSRTVGWFTSLFPVWLDLGTADAPGSALKAMKEQLRRIPQRGISYGILRYLGDDNIKQQLKAMPQAEVRFNYLGQSDQVFFESSFVAPARESTGAVRSGRSQRGVLLEINGIVTGGQLRLDWIYSRAIHRRTTIATLSQQFMVALRTLIDHCLSPEAGGYTPSDFPQMQLDQAELDELLADL